MFVLVYEGENSGSKRFGRSRRRISVERCEALRPVRTLQMAVSREDIEGGRFAARRISQAAFELARLSCGVGICAESFGEHADSLLRALGLRPPDRRPLLRMCAGRLALAALGGRECELAAVYANRLTREVAEAIACVAGRVRSVALMLREDAERCADALYAEYGVATVSAKGVAAEADFHVVFDSPRGGLRARTDSLAVSLCGEVAGLPRESYTSADIRPPESLRPPGFRAAEVAAALYQQRALPAEKMRIVRLSRP